MRSSFVAVLLLLALLPATALGERSAPARRMLDLWRSERNAGQRLTAATRTRLRGRVFGEYPTLLGRKVKPLSKRRGAENPDPTFRGTHPTFQRLARQGWYARSAQIGALQRKAEGLTRARKLDRGTPLSQLEVVAFDLEATFNRAGRFDRKRGRLLFGYDEPTQLGYVVYRGGKRVREGTINIKPDVAIHPKATQITGLSAKSLAGAPRFERVAGEILELLSGRVLVGQSAAKNDWAWLRSSFARLGVRLPGPEGIVLDTHLLSYNHSPAKGEGLAALAKRYRVRQFRHHDARADAGAAGDVFFAMMREAGARTLGQAFDLQAKGDAIRHHR